MKNEEFAPYQTVWRETYAFPLKTLLFLNFDVPGVKYFIKNRKVDSFRFLGVQIMPRINEDPHFYPFNGLLHNLQERIPKNKFQKLHHLDSSQSLLFCCQ